MNKYRAKRTYSALCSRTFASKLEAQRGEELAMLEKAGEISGLQYQVKFLLSKKPRITISIDFVYKMNGRQIYEDAKGILTRDFRTKRAWLQEKYKVKVKLWQGLTR